MRGRHHQDQAAPAERRSGRHGTRLIDDLVLILARYYLAYDIIFGMGVYLAFLLPYDWSTAMQVVRALDVTAADCSVRSMD